MRNRVAKYTKPNSSNLEKRTYYIRDAQGNVMATYSAWVKNNSGVITWDSMRLSEQHIYGSARVGMALTNVKLYPAVPKNPHLSDTSHYPIFEGWKRYEISNHLGNVLAVITDRKRGSAASGTAIQWFDADVVASQQYYPFGMLMPGDGPGVSASWKRQYTLNGNDYRYGFNGKEGDDEVKGDDNQQDYGMRIYDPRVGRFLSVDPLLRQFPWNTPYSFAENDVISAIDLDGLEKFKVVLMQTQTGWDAEISIPDYERVSNSLTGREVEYYLQPLGAQRPRRLVTKTEFDTQYEIQTATKYTIVRKSPTSREGRWENTDFQPMELSNSIRLVNYRGTRTQVDVPSTDVGEIYSVVVPALVFQGVAVESDGSISMKSESARNTFRRGVDYMRDKWIPAMSKPRDGEKAIKGFMIQSASSDQDTRIREVGIIKQRLIDEGISESLLLTSDIQASGIGDGFSVERIVEEN